MMKLASAIKVLDGLSIRLALCGTFIFVTTAGASLAQAQSPKHQPASARLPCSHRTTRES